jgi:hypothetical protein
LFAVALEDVSQADIYRALGILEGKLDALVHSLTQQNIDLATALGRVRELEKTVYMGVGVALTCSVVIPLLVTAANPRISVEASPVPGHPSATGR